MKLTWRQPLALGMAVIAAIVATLPLRWGLVLAGLGQEGFTAADVRGTVWRGSLVNVRVQGITLGDVQLSLSPAALLRLQPAYRFTTASASGQLRMGRVSGIDAAQGQLGLPAVGSLGGVALGLQLDRATVLFEGNACQRAGGAMELQLTPPAGLKLEPLVLAGALSCSGKQAAAELTESAEGPIPGLSARVEIDRSGRWQVQFLAPANNTQATLLLESLGFASDGTRWSRQLQGQLFAGPQPGTASD